MQKDGERSELGAFPFLFLLALLLLVVVVVCVRVWSKVRATVRVGRYVGR